jgi:hypothetical protein
MFTLSPTPVASEYEAGKQGCRLGKGTVKTAMYTNESRSGSWERGFKFSSNTYGYLVKQLKGTKYYKPSRYSPDHGKTWYETLDEAKKQRAGKIKFASRTAEEFSFTSIQKINRKYDPNYKWRP